MAAVDDTDPARRVTFHDLEVLLAFSSTEHLGHTARHLGVSAGSVQRTIRALEGKLGVRLVERDGRRVRLRHSGWVLARESARLLRSRADAVDVVRAAAGADQVPLRIGHTFSLGVAVVPRVVAAFQARSPGARVTLRQGAATHVIATLLAGEIDAAFTSISPVEPDVRVVPLFEEPMLLAVPSGDPLAAEPAVAPARVADRGFVAMSEGSSSRGFLMRACARAGFTPRVVLDTDDLFSVAGAVAAGIGVSILPGRMSDYAHPGITLLPLIEPVPTRRTICLAYRRQSTREPHLDALRETAQQYAATE